MNTVILLLNEADTLNLPNAAQRLLQDGTTHLWILASPAVTVSTKEAVAAIEEEIAGISKLMDAAALRKDFSGADGYKKQLEAKQLDRAKAIGDAWKKVEKAEREKAFLEGPLAAFIAPLKEAEFAIKARFMEDHHDATDVANLLKKYEQVAPFTPGSYGLRFARTYSAPTESKIVQTMREVHNELSGGASQKPPVPAIEKPKTDVTRNYSGAELEAMHHFTLAAVAKHHGVFEKGKPKQDTIRDILGKMAVLA